MSKEEVAEARRLQVFQKHVRVIERMAWRNLDFEQFAESHLDFMKDLCRASPQVRKSELRATMASAKLALTPAECALFVDKVKGSISYCRTRLRNKGSGKFLPPACRALARVWARVAPKGSKKKLAAQGPEKKKLAEEDPEPEKVSEPEVPVAEKVPEATTRRNIREVFQLKEKKGATSGDRVRQ